MGDDLRLKNDEYERRIEGYVKQTNRGTEQIEALQAKIEEKTDLVRKKNEEIEHMKKRIAKVGKDLDTMTEKKEVMIIPLSCYCLHQDAQRG